MGIDDTRFVVIGATGFTGGLVAHELARGQGEVLLTARDPRRLEPLAARLGATASGPISTARVDVTEQDTLRRVLRPGDVVINCAGPFSRLGAPVVEACIDRRAHYLDTSGEQRFLKRVFDEFDRPAAGAGVILVSGAAFEYAIGDCLAGLVGREAGGSLLSLDVFYRWPNGASASSRGTRRSVLQVVRDGGWAYQRGKHRSRRTGAARCPVRLADGRKRTAVWFPAGEIVTVPRHVQVEEVSGWMVVGRRTGSWLPRFAPALPGLVRAVQPLADWVIDRGPDGPAPDERDASRFMIEIVATPPAGERICAAVEGKDPYGITAVIAAELGRHVAAREGPRPGALAPAELMEPLDLLHRLQPHGVSWAATCSVPAG
jgi:short subunit dehydrogenase-like uncharacterized protein